MSDDDLKKAAALHQAILDCECGAWCNDCCDRFGELGDLLEVNILPANPKSRE